MTKPLVSRVFAFVNASLALLILLAVFAVVNRERMPDGFGAFLAIRVTVKNLILAGLFLLAWVMSFRAFDLSRPKRKLPFRKELLQTAKACIVATLFALLFPLTSHSNAFTAGVLLYFLPASILTSLFGRLAARVLMERFIPGRRDLIIVGSGPRAAGIYERLRKTDYTRTRVLGFVDSPNGHPVPAAIRQQMLGSLDELEGILANHPLDEVLIALPAKSCYDQIQSAIQACERVGVEAKYLSDVFEVSLARPSFEPDDEAPVVSLKVVQDDYRLLVKRCIDFLGASLGLVFFAPLMGLIACAIKFTSQGPTIFVQERYGLNKRRFRMYKFRTMVQDAEKQQAGIEHLNEAQGPVFKIRKDPRITPIGRLLRKTSLDELPQFLNVFKGDMSLVGPRPLPLRDVSRFDDASLMRRFSVKPGLTCLWQVNGRSDTDFGRWMELDLRYIDQWSLLLDATILARTIPAVIRGKGAA